MTTRQPDLNLTLADLIDRMTISQIKETLLDGPRRDLFTQDLADAAEDVDGILGAVPIAASGRLIRLIMLMAQCNLHVWANKDRMQQEPDAYTALLVRAQELNGLRNHARNLMMEDFGEMSPAARRATFLEQDNRWYVPILRGLGKK